MDSHRKHSQDGWPEMWRSAALVCLLAGIVALLVYVLPRTPQEVDTKNVPLGVEQAAIVTYSGPTVTVAPYKWGVAVNVRIAEVVEQPGKRIYDVRYIINRGGTFDLKDYLIAADGSTLQGLPSFQVTGDPKLSKDLDNRIQETEEVTVDVGGRYYETMAVLGALWIGWLLLLIFYKRPHAAAKAEAVATGPSSAEILRAMLQELQAGTLDADAKAKMEMTLLRRWREELALDGVPMDAALDEMSRSAKTGDPLRKLQNWLYHPASPIGSQEIAAVIEPYAVEANLSAASPQP